MVIVVYLKTMNCTLKRVNCMACKLHLNKVVTEKITCLDSFASMSINYLQNDTFWLPVGRTWVAMGARTGGDFY